MARGFDIGLLPLPNDDFAAGKSPIKGLQYMASGAATVVSPLGATQSMFSEGETALFARDTRDWSAALEKLLDAGLRHELAHRARHTVEQHHALSTVAPRLADRLRQLALGCPR